MLHALFATQDNQILNNCTPFLKDFQNLFQAEAQKNAKALEDAAKRLNEEKAISMDLRKKLGETADLQARVDQSAAKLATASTDLAAVRPVHSSSRLDTHCYLRFRKRSRFLL